MNVQEAMSIAQNMKNHFKAFEKFDEFMKFVASSESRVSELESQAAKLSKEVQATAIAKEKVQADHQKMVLETAAKADKHMSKLISDADAKHEELQNTLSDLTTEINDKRDEIEKLVEEHSQKVNAQHDEIESLTTTIADLKSELTKLRDKVSAL